MYPRSDVGIIAAFIALVALSAGGVSYGVVLMTRGGSHGTEPPRLTQAEVTDAAECPSFMMRDRDAQLEAAYMAGFRKARLDTGARQAEAGLRDCMQRLMECRNVEAQP